MMIFRRVCAEAPQTKTNARNAAPKRKRPTACAVGRTEVNRVVFVKLRVLESELQRELNEPRVVHRILNLAESSPRRADVIDG